MLIIVTPKIHERNAIFSKIWYCRHQIHTVRVNDSPNIDKLIAENQRRICHVRFTPNKRKLVFYIVEKSSHGYIFTNTFLVPVKHLDLFLENFFSVVSIYEFYGSTPKELKSVSKGKRWLQEATQQEIPSTYPFSNREVAEERNRELRENPPPARVVKRFR